jgi:Sel1 repeat
MRLVLATKREIDMGERKLLFLMNQEQAQDFVRLLGAAERGDGAAACRLGDLYREGLGGLRYSPRQTFHWYARSAMAGDANGQNNLGACYEHGLGGVQSYPKAVKWYRLAAAQGLAYASSNLGYCYLQGHGVPADKAKAVEWLENALAQGDERAEGMIERLEGDRDVRVSEPVPADTLQVRPWKLALGVVPRDGPPKQHRRPGIAATESTEDRAAIATAATASVDEAESAWTPVQNVSDEPDRSKVRVIRSIRFVDETQPRKNLGIVGIGGVARPGGDATEAGDTEEQQ